MEAIEAIRAAMEWAGIALDIVAVAVIVTGVVVAAIQTGPIRALLMTGRTEPRFKQQRLGSLLLGLDLLVASDVIQTAAVETTLSNVSALGLLVLIRIALTWSLVVEAEGRWPWQSPPSGKNSAGTAGEMRKGSEAFGGEEGLDVRESVD